MKCCDNIVCLECLITGCKDTIELPIISPVTGVIKMFYDFNDTVVTRDINVVSGSSITVTNIFNEDYSGLIWFILPDDTQLNNSCYILKTSPVINLDMDPAASTDTPYQPLSEKGQPNGYTPLGPDNKVPSAFLPATSVPLSVVGMFYMNANSTPTPNPGIGIFAKMKGITIANTLSGFTMPQSNRLTYMFTASINCIAIVTGTLTSTAGNDIAVRIAKNDITMPESEVTITTEGAGSIKSFMVITTVSLNADDYLEVWVSNKNSASNNITARDLTLVIR